MAVSPAKICSDAAGMRKPHQRIHGLTLIEVLVALAIIAIALTAIIKAASQNIRGTDYLQRKTVAFWVADRAMSEVRSGVTKISGDSGNDRHASNTLGSDWYWYALQTSTPNKRIKKITVTVYDKEEREEDESPIITLEGYLYADKE